MTTKRTHAGFQAIIKTGKDVSGHDHYQIQGMRKKSAGWDAMGLVFRSKGPAEKFAEGRSDIAEIAPCTYDFAIGDGQLNVSYPCKK